MSFVGCSSSGLQTVPCGIMDTADCGGKPMLSCSLTIASVLLSGNELTAWDQPFTLNGLTVFNYERSLDGKEKCSEEVRTTLKIAVILGLFCCVSSFDAVTDCSHDRESSPSLHHIERSLSQLTSLASFFVDIRLVLSPQAREYGSDSANYLLLHQCQKLHLVMAKRSQVQMKSYYFGQKGNTLIRYVCSSAAGKRMWIIRTPRHSPRA